MRARAASEIVETANGRMRLSRRISRNKKLMEECMIWKASQPLA